MKKTNGIKQLPKRLKYTSAFIDRHGKTRWRFRKKGRPTVYLDGEAGSPEFIKSYIAALDGKANLAKAISARVTKRSIADLIIRYKQSRAFLDTSPTTQRVYSRLLGKIRNDYGSQSVAALKRRHIIMIQQNKAASPHTANRLVSLMHIMLDLAVDLDWVETNAAKDVKKFKVKSNGFHAWSEDEIAQYEVMYGSGTKQRLALYLLLYTAQRGSDVVHMGRQRIRNGRISVNQQKTGTFLEVPIHQALQAEISNWEGNMTFLLTEYGKPFSVKGFQQWFAQSARNAGLKHCTAHGLRKAAARRLAEIGATASQIMAITGHKTLSEAERYTRSANQITLADSAIELLHRGKIG